MTPPVAVAPASLASAASDDDLQEISLVELFSVLVKRWKLVFGLPILTAVITAVVSLLLAPKYQAVTTFVPEPQSGG